MHLSIWWLLEEIAMFLPVVQVRFNEHYLMAARVQSFADPAVIGGGAIPVCRDQTGAE
jgi:hypothetical protein